MNYPSIKNDLKEYIFIASGNDAIGTVHMSLKHIIEYVMYQSNNII